MDKEKALVNRVLLILNIIILVVNIALFVNNTGNDEEAEEPASEQEPISLNISGTHNPGEQITQSTGTDNIYIKPQRQDFKWTADSTDTKKIIELDYMSQKDYPTGCESVTTCMVLKYMGYDISIDTFIDEYLDTFDIMVNNGIMYGEDPNEYFIGNPRSSSGYGCYSPVIKKALVKIAGENAVHDLQGRSIEEMIEKYVSNGIPVIMWATIGMNEAEYGGTWYISRTSQIYSWLAGEHCLLLAGWDEYNYYFYDPNSGVVPYNKELVSRRYKEMGGQALALVKMNTSENK